jgi:predicted dienelactone hydrolase
MRTILKVIAVLVLLVLGMGGYYFWRTMPRIPERPFTRPSGPYPVGTREFFWTDSTRGEPYTRDSTDHRRVVVQVWYPAGPARDTVPALYLERPGEFASRMGAWAARKARTNSVLDAPLANSDSGYPVLVYNHGGAWTRWSATYATEWLASYGYVVFSIEHFGFNQTVKYPDGSPFKADTLNFPAETGDKEKDALASWAFLDDPVFLIWKADTRFVLDQIEAQNRAAGPFQGRLDLTRIGMFGWSIGGALAVQMSAADPRVKAAVNHDGQLFGDVRERGTSRPIMQIHHGADDALDYPDKDRPAVRKMMALVASWDSTARDRSTGDWYDVTIAGTDHGNFSDLTLFYPRGKDRVDPKRAHQIIDAYTLAFFDRYLREKDSRLLAGGEPTYPETSFRSWMRAAKPVRR